MLDLHAGVHFDEIELAVFVQELERARATIAYFAAGFCAAFADLVAQFGIEPRGGRLFQHFLVATLHRAVAFAQVHSIAMLVCENLDLDMTRRLQELFHVNHGIAEEALRFRAGHGDGVQQRRLAMHHAHATPAAAPAALMMTG